MNHIKNLQEIHRSIAIIVLRFFSVIISIILVTCGIPSEFDVPVSNCTESMTANISFADLKALLAKERLMQIQEDLIIEGYINSSDQEGNFFNTLHLQETNSDSSDGFQMEIELSDSYLAYPIGAKVFIKLNGLYIGRNNGVYKIGSAFNSFGSLAIGRLPTLILDNHVFLSCTDISIITPRKVKIDSLNEGMVNTLVQIQELELIEEELGMPYALPEEETVRILRDCSGKKLKLINSGYADFQSEILPEGNGSIRGILLKESKDYMLKIRTKEDIVFNGERCIERQILISSDQIFISEIADPDNEREARFVELFNSSEMEIILDGWELHRYTNAQTEISSKIDLTGMVIPALGTLVIAANATSFKNVYGFSPDIGAGINSPADSNGDDNLQLVDPFQDVVDSFGIPGEDGSGTNHEFEDGGAFRRAIILKGSPDYIFDQWEIFNDSGNSGTINQPLLAPQDFTPGVR